MRLAIMVSDHGWGHLNRSLVIAEAAIADGHTVGIVAATRMARAVARTVPQAAFIAAQMDRGYVFGRHGAIDAAPSLQLAAECAQGPAPSLIRELAAWQPDVILADATPWASTVARSIGAPSVLCSNFSWDDEYESAFGLTEEVVSVRAFARAFDLGLELPLGSGTPSVLTRQKVPLLARQPSARAGEFAGTDLVTWAMGGTPPAAQPLWAVPALQRACAKNGLRLAMDEELASAIDAPAVALPHGAAWADVLAASRIVITKAGYSTVAEALRGAGYVVAIGLTGLAQERAMIAEIESCQYGWGIPASGPDLDVRLGEAVAALAARGPREPRRERGEAEILRVLDDLARAATDSSAAGAQT